MTKFVVTDTCNACGICFQLTDLLEETAEGKASPNNSKYISDDYLNQAKGIVEKCPVHALEIITTRSTTQTGTAGLKELANKLKQQLGGVEFPSVTIKDIAFDAKPYPVDWADPRGENDYRYSSESQAERAGLDEFDRIAYSQYRPFILSIFVQYKNDKLKPFYTFKADKVSFYFNLNQKYENILREIENEAIALTNGKLQLPQNFSNFEVYPGTSSTDGFAQERINARLGEFEKRSTTSGIMAEFNSSEYHKLKAYTSYFDTSDMEMYDGEDWRGRSKFKTKYGYYRISAAVAEYIKDLKSTMNYLDTEINEETFSDITEALNMYKKELSIAVELKIKIFTDSISKTNL